MISSSINIIGSTLLSILLKLNFNHEKAYKISAKSLGAAHIQASFYINWIITAL